MGGGAWLRAIRKEAKQETVIEAALRLFEEKGYDATTIDEIAAASGVSRRTLFRYFPSKEQLVFGPVEEYLEALVRTIDEAGVDEADASVLVRSVLELCRRVDGDAELFRNRVHLILHDETLLVMVLRIHALWEDRVARALARRSDFDRPTLAQRMLAAVAIGAHRNGMRRWIELRGARCLEECTRDALAVVWSTGLPAAVADC